ncbi:unnamed protein product [Rangifer tarandus platyrhynchus]|uniref:Uncharacterized protein n=2 Tax=Rangifer tarandus platyrhynchus TaxID=3082113 RepID=A0ACB0EX93_RANTA|nr:unnamed protein product [Rangifer tarandus platyrhynchus]CAI9705330.1 unnamed protein product [Rangifer tarandus platyrhynchus]
MWLGQAQQGVGAARTCKFRKKKQQAVVRDKGTGESLRTQVGPLAKQVKKEEEEDNATSGSLQLRDVGPPPEDQRMLTSPHSSQSVAPFGEVATELLLEAFPRGCVARWPSIPKLRWVPSEAGAALLKLLVKGKMDRRGVLSCLPYQRWLGLDPSTDSSCHSPSGLILTAEEGVRDKAASVPHARGALLPALTPLLSPVPNSTPDGS